MSSSSQILTTQLQDRFLNFLVLKGDPGGRKKKRKQAGAELGQAQLKLGLDFTLFFGRFGLVELVCWVSFCRFDLKDFA